MTSNGRVPGFWKITGLTLTYLIFELAFNARLLDVTGSIPSQVDLDRIEVLGRSLSGIGASLIIWGLLGKRNQRFRVFQFILIALVTCPAVYIGQKALVDSLVSRASPLERKYTYYLTTVSVATMQNAAKLKGLDLPNEAYSTPEGKAFFAVFPALAYSSPGLMEQLDSQLEPLVMEALRRQVGAPEYLYNYYYVPMANAVRLDVFDHQYIPASLQVRNGATNQGERAWAEYQQELARRHINPATSTAFVHEQVIRKLRQRNIRVPDDWALDDKAGFLSALPAGASPERVFNQRVSAFLGFQSTLPPGLLWPQFEKHPDVQRLVRMKLKEKVPNFEPGPGPLDLSATFEKFFIETYTPSLEKAAREKVATLRKDSSTYDDGGINFEDGRKAMTAVLVPPIALMFSLFFGLSNIISLIVGLLPLSKPFSFLAKCAAYAAVFWFPFTWTNPVTQSELYLRLETQVTKNGRPFAWGLRWVTQAAPAFYPVTSRAKNLLAPLHLFESEDN